MPAVTSDQDDDSAEENPLLHSFLGSLAKLSDLMTDNDC